MILTLAACSDYQIRSAEQTVLPVKVEDLAGASQLAGDLSKAYIKAAANTSTVQDVFAFLTITAAGAVVVGSVGSTSDATLARRGAAGALSTTVARRAAPQTAITSIYQAAKQMNCISTVARIGSRISVEDAGAAADLTVGAIEYVRISARERVVRSVADYSEVFGVLSAGAEREAETSNARRGLRNSASGNSMTWETYAKLLGKCTASTDPKPSGTVE